MAQHALIGITSDLTLDANQVRDTELLGVPARSFSAVDDRGIHMIVNTGFRNGRVLIFGAFAPSKEALDVFTPTFQMMLGSLRPLRGTPTATATQAAPTQVSASLLSTGSWQSSDRAITLRFNPDGSYLGAYTATGFPFDVGRYQLHGTTLTLQNSERSPICSGMSGRYQLTVSSGGELSFVLEQDSCDNRGAYLPTVHWDQNQR